MSLELAIRVASMKTRTLAWFEKNRREQHAAATQIVCELINPKGKKGIVASASVKAGKKDIKITTSLKLSQLGENTNVRHVFVSSFYRKDCLEQKAELIVYGWTVLYGQDINGLSDLVNNHPDVFFVVHVDESDWGTGESQKLAKQINAVWLLSNVRLIFYSATNAEIMYSEFADECASVYMDDPESFYGPDDFLNDGLVTEAEPFVDMDEETFTSQGNLCTKLLSSQKPFGVVRLVGNDDHSVLMRSKKFEQECFKRKITPIFVSDHMPMFWGRLEKYSGKGHSWHQHKKGKVLYFLNQTCVRSTEIGFHPKIAFWHDYRTPDRSNYATLTQALFRVNHYPYTVEDGNENGHRHWTDPSVRIHLFGCVETAKLAAARQFEKAGKPHISDQEYREHSGRSLSARIKNEANSRMKAVVSINADNCFDIHSDMMQTLAYVHYEQEKMNSQGKIRGKMGSRTRNEVKISHTSPHIGFSKKGRLALHYSPALWRKFERAAGHAILLPNTKRSDYDADGKLTTKEMQMDADGWIEFATSTRNQGGFQYGRTSGLWVKPTLSYNVTGSITYNDLVLPRAEVEVKQTEFTTVRSVYSPSKRRRN